MKRTTSVLALTIGLTGLAVSHPAQAASLDSVASADTHVGAGHPSTTHGDATALVVDGRAGRTKHAFLRFTVPAVPAGEEIDSVSLRLRAKASSPDGVSVYATGDGWAEGTLTWADKPGRGALLGSSDALLSGTTEAIDLDSAGLAPGQVLSVRVETSAGVRLPFVSSEGSRSARPVLRVTTTSDPVPGTPPTTPTTPPGTPPAPEQPPGASWPPAGAVTRKVIGMSAPQQLWGTRLGEVGAEGVGARRIFADLTASGSGQLPLIREAIADGMTPVISYKVPSAATLAGGGYDGWLALLRSQLVALDAPVTATFWHEPHGDVDPVTFRAASLRFLEVVDAPDIAVGPILNGWLLDRRVADFAAFTDPTLLSRWEFVGVDSYQAGSAASPGSLLPARAVPQLAAWLEGQGFPDKKIVLGEYNGFTAAAIAQAGEWVLSTPELWIGNVWNTDHTTFSVLSGDRLAAFRATKADTRAAR